jgi:hypothetical protein
MGGEYSNDWDQFINKIQQHTPPQRASFLERCTLGNGRIGMIVTLAKEWRTQTSHKRHTVMAATRRRRLIESVRWMPRLGEFRSYVSVEFRVSMPGPSVHKSTAVRTRNNDHTARLFFTANTPGIFHNKPIHKIIQRSYRLSSQAWAAAHPYGPPPSREQVRHLQEHFINRTVLQKKPIGGFNPAGMTPERAIEIAIQVLDRVS